ncbi:MAG: YheC/YheD family protein [Bacillota bacterium]|jgi:glutathione synthase/RimK-type ligase-like ATP-grasp enzyme|nr:YheC/YheD family protein [Bacillota bacterium]HOB90592.1 YheC/YheD family protein [Bacillota bacterium]HPZ53562.1 YheC/YheD family protein [Bacillota bacterium]HQD17123.1 YheC/YheD family protein [Bacillota bacterium]
MRCKRSPEKLSTLRLGVFIDEHRDKPPYGEQNTYVTRLAARARSMGIDLFAFSIPQKSVDQGRLQVRYPERSWSISQARLPHVVYDRAIFTRRSDKLAARSLLRQLQARGVLVFNPVIGSKLVIHRQLESVPGVSHLLPDTARVIDVETVHQFLKKWGDVFVKPSVGTQGRGVLRIVRRGERFETSGFTNKLDYIEYTDLDKNGLNRLLRSIIGSRTHMVQRAVETLKLGGSRTDVRSLVQKDRTGAWRVTGAAARVAEGSSSVTNLHRGGRALPLSELVQGIGEAAGIDFRSIENEINRASIAVSEALSQRYSLLGELGLDFIIGKDGRVWLIEVNPRPGRNVLRNSGMDDAARLGDERPLEYAQYLVSAVRAARGRR